MSLYRKVKNVKGIMKISVEGFFIERFINLCLQKNIEIWDIERINEGIINVKIFYINYEEICEIADTTRCKILIIEKNGAPFFIKRYKHRKLFVALIVIITILIVILNMFIWKIDIIGEFSIPIEEVKKILEDENIRVGTFKKNIDINKIKLDVILKREDIAWMGINIKGNRVIVEIVEKELEDKDIYKNTVGNIISNKSGIVEKIYVADGTAVVKKGELIQPGTLLISGLISKENAEPRYVRADGEITLKTTYVQKTKIPIEKDVISKTGNVEKSYKLKINNYFINLTNKVTNFEKYDTITKENTFSLFGYFTTPIVLIEETFEEIEVDRIKYTKKQAEDLGIISNNEKLKSIIPMNAKKINYYNNIRESEEYIEVETIVQCLENTGTYEKIEGNVK